MKPVSTGNVLTAATQTTIYTVPTGYYARWTLCYVVNHSGNNKFIDIVWYDSSTATEVHVFDNYVLSTTQSVTFGNGNYVVLEEGDQVRATSETGSTMNTINTFELYRKGE
jgi:hypothetical protein